MPDRLGVVDVDEVPARLALARGEPQLRIRNGIAYAPRLVRATAVPADPCIGADDTVLVTGASGGLGGAVARHLAPRVRRLVLLSRHGSAGQPDPDVTVVECDVADRVALARVFADLEISAVVHAAGVVDDGIVETLTGEQVEAVLRPKVDGMLNLHHLATGSTAFVLFSSAAGVLGSAGQANYAAANAFLDAFAHLRRAQGPPTTSLASGWWDVGIGARMSPAARRRKAADGGRPLSIQDGLALFDAALRLDRAVVVPMRRSARTAPPGNPVPVPERSMLDVVLGHAA